MSFAIFYLESSVVMWIKLWSFNCAHNVIIQFINLSKFILKGS